jgi:aminoglycoside phosphotransferase (APT) family kinase protein
MGFIDGHPLYTADDTRQWVPEPMRQRLAYSFIDVLADLHALDPDEIGLGDLGKRDSYIARQVKAWYRSWTSSVGAAGFDDPRAHELQAYFLAHLPDPGQARVVHGDYGLHNCLTGTDCTIAAVVDWEISTLGDPLADLAYALNWWPDPGDPPAPLRDRATTVPGFPPRSELRDRYAELIRTKYPNIPRRVSGYNLDQLLPENGFHVARALVGSEGTCVVVLDAKVKDIW